MLISKIRKLVDKNAKINVLFFPPPLAIPTMLN